jgi:hypothetical protein
VAISWWLSRWKLPPICKKQKELLEEFAKISGEEAHPMKKGFLDKVMDFLS